MSRARYLNTFCYLILRAFARDWHAVWDAAIDLHAQEGRDPELRHSELPATVHDVSDG